jgi:hypothetical protein
MRLTLAVTVGLISLAQGAVAKITPDDFWAYLQAESGATAKVERQGDKLILRDVLAKESAASQTSFPLIELQETEQGVEMRVPKGLRVQMDRWSFDGLPPQKAVLALDTSQQLVTITGADMSQAQFEATFPTLTIRLVELAGAAVADGTLVITAKDGHLRQQKLAGSDRVEMDLGELDLMVSKLVGPNSQNLRMSLQKAELDLNFSMPDAALAPGLSAQDSIKAGLVFDMALRSGQGQMTFAEGKPQESTLLIAAFTKAGLEMALGPQGMSLAQSAEGLSLTNNYQSEDPEKDPTTLVIGAADYSVHLAATLDAMTALQRRDGTFPKGLEMGAELALRDLLLSLGPKEIPLIDFQASSTSAKFAIDDQALDLSVGVAGYDLLMSGQMGQDLRFSVEEIGLALAFPVNRVGEAAPFRLEYKILGQTMSDSFWNLFDGAKLFPRDPLNFDLAMDNVVTLRRPLTEISQADIDSGDLPLEINSAKLTRLLLSGFGAEITGTGSAELDYSDVTTAGDMPKGDGAFSFDLKGINGLFDKLEQRGFLSSDQLTGARMGLMMFAKPAGEADHMTSEAELRDGRFYLNGMLMR